MASNSEIEAWLKEEEFPWDECIRKMKKEYGSLEKAQKVCAAIKNRTVKHSLSRGLAGTYSEAVQKIKEKIEKDPLFSYALMRLAEKEVKEPFGPWKDWDDCMRAMKKEGYDDETARKICGKLKKKLEGEKLQLSTLLKVLEEAGK